MVYIYFILQQIDPSNSVFWRLTLFGRDLFVVVCLSCWGGKAESVFVDAWCVRTRLRLGWQTIRMSRQIPTAQFCHSQRCAWMCTGTTLTPMLLFAKLVSSFLYHYSFYTFALLNLVVDLPFEFIYLVSPFFFRLDKLVLSSFEFCLSLFCSDYIVPWVEV